MNKPGDLSSESANEPMSFSLGTIMSEKFSPIDENENSLSNNNYSWDIINESESTISQETIDKFSNNNSDKKNLPSMEDIMKQRASEFN